MYVAKWKIVRKLIFPNICGPHIYDNYIIAILFHVHLSSGLIEFGQERLFRYQLIMWIPVIQPN